MADIDYTHIVGEIVSVWEHTGVSGDYLKRPPDVVGPVRACGTAVGGGGVMAFVVLVEQRMRGSRCATPGRLFSAGQYANIYLGDIAGVLHDPNAIVYGPPIVITTVPPYAGERLVHPAPGRSRADYMAEAARFQDRLRGNR